MPVGGKLCKLCISYVSVKCKVYVSKSKVRSQKKERSGNQCKVSSWPFCLCKSVEVSEKVTRRIRGEFVAYPYYYLEIEYLPGTVVRRRCSWLQKNGEEETKKNPDTDSSVVQRVRDFPVCRKASVETRNVVREEEGKQRKKRPQTPQDVDGPGLHPVGGGSTGAGFLFFSVSNMVGAIFSAFLIYHCCERKGKAEQKDNVGCCVSSLVVVGCCCCCCCCCCPGCCC